MTRNWKITEKVIAGLQIVWGTCILILTIWSIKLFLDGILIHLEYDWRDLSVIRLIRHYHYQILLPSLTIFAGIALLLTKKSGWMMGVVTSALSGISMIQIVTRIKERELEYEILAFAFSGLITLVFIIMFGLLLSNQIRSKYNPTRKAWLVMGIIFTFLLLDRILIN